MSLNPGIHLDVMASTYFSDPAPEPSLTQSLAKVLLDRSPLHAWYGHPRLNPDWRENDEKKFDLGSTAHSLLIGRGKSLQIIDANDWRTADAKKKREEAAAEGKLGVLAKQYGRAAKMVLAAKEQLEMRGLGRFFNEGNGEVVTVWREGDVYLRQMIDWVSPDLREIIDFKSTDMSVAPHNIDRMMVNAGWSIQAAMAERGLDNLDPKNAGRRKFYFVVQETEVPYQLTVVELTRGPMMLGGKQLQRAVEIWSECMAANIWPGYPLDVVKPEWPGWAEQQWLDREVKDAARERMPQDYLMAG